jgi:hypothetical protein
LALQVLSSPESDLLKKKAEEVEMQVFASGMLLLLKHRVSVAMSIVSARSFDEGTSLSASRMSRLNPASIKSREEVLTVVSMTLP